MGIYVSIHLMLLFIEAKIKSGRRNPLCFNTSHVVIYRLVSFTSATVPSAFQYISCCYLSIDKIIKAAEKKFQ